MKLVIGITLLSIMIVHISCQRCQEDRYNIIIDSEKPIYKTGDNLVYKNNFGQMDTFVVKMYSDIDYFIDDGGTCTQSGTHNSEITIGFYTVPDSALNNNSMNNSFSVGIVSDNYILGWLNSRFETGYMPVKYQQILPSYTINNKLYNSVYEVSIDTAGLIPCAASKIYFNLRYCVLKYIQKNGTVWELQ